MKINGEGGIRTLG